MKTNTKFNLTDFFEKEKDVLHWGISLLQDLPHSSNLKNWVQKGYHADLKYMENNLESRTDPIHFKPWAKSVILFSLPYSCYDQKNKGNGYKVAKYAQMNDYHYTGKQVLKNLEEFLRQNNYVGQFFGFVDSLPVFERDLAILSGLGWNGKNTCTIHPEHGSYFLLAGVLIDVALESNPPIKDYCGSCTACLEACPTDAFIAPYKLDTNKCISYWTIENKKEIPEEIKKNLHGWIFGCDICQDVCPWNQKKIETKNNSNSILNNKYQKSGLDWVTLLKKGGGFQKEFKFSPLMRAGRKRMLRNVAAVACNYLDFSLEDDFKTLLKDEQDSYVISQLNNTMKIFEIEKSKIIPDKKMEI